MWQGVQSFGEADLPAACLLPAGLASRCRASEAGDGSRWRGEPQARPGGALAIGGGAGRVGRPQHQREGGQVARHEVGRRGRWKRPFVFPMILFEIWNDVTAKQLDRVHDARVRQVAHLHEAEYLVDAGLLVFLQHLDDRIRRAHGERA
jgi:hypothetical protein